MPDRKSTISIAARIDMGRIRSNNEDNFIVCPDLLGQHWVLPQPQENVIISDLGVLVAVADGMGGTNAGEVASGIAIEAVRDSFSRLPPEILGNEQRSRDFLAGVIEDAHRRIVQHARENTATEGMGTTLVLLWLLADHYFCAWCGDSRAYLFHPLSGLQQISKDHSYVQTLVDRGQLTKEQAFYHPESNIITRSLGNPTGMAAPDIVSGKWYDDTRFLLCSDGLSGMLEDATIEKILVSNLDTDGCASRLLQEALEAGGHDNVTLVLAHGHNPHVLAKTPTIPESTNKKEQAELSSTLKSCAPPPKKQKHHIGRNLFIALVVLVIAYFGWREYSRSSSLPGDVPNPVSTTDTTPISPVTEPDTAYVPLIHLPADSIHHAPESNDTKKSPSLK
jgi:protein phosphatase